LTLVRFAPSPTGRLHVGNVRTGLINWLFARQQGGRFLLRLDDTDADRSTVEFARGIEEDLSWLGLAWDLFTRQSDHLGRYAEAAERLKASGHLYPCFESAAELSFKRKARLAAGLPPIYDRAARQLSKTDIDHLQAAGRRPHWRFLLPSVSVDEDTTGIVLLQDLYWNDLVRGLCPINLDAVSDPVLVREDGSPTYTLSSVVDDIEFMVTHVIRGEDHVSNTGVQIQIFEALSASVPTFGHMPLIADAAGDKLSKRLESLSIARLREDGIEPMAINSLLAHLGTSDAVEPYVSLDELLRNFDIGHFGRATPKFDPDELPHLNHRLLQRLGFADVRDRLPSGADERFWLAVRPNLQRLADAGEWWAVVNGPIRPAIEDVGFVTRAHELLPAEPWSEATWGFWTKSLGAATGRKGKDLYRPLRLALTAREHGPELKSLLVLIGRARTEARLLGKEA
jgi:glutamyl-tRNA synthetase